MQATMTAERPRAHSRDRIATLHDMLTRYHEARSEASGVGGGGTRLEGRLLAFDSQTWTREYQELDRCLQRLRWLAEHGRPMIEHGVSSGAAWWHLRQRYLEAHVGRREIHMRKTPAGERVPIVPRNMEVVARPTILQGKTQMLLVRSWDQRVDPQVVGAALRWISREFRGTPASYSVA